MTGTGKETMRGAIPRILEQNLEYKRGVEGQGMQCSINISRLEIRNGNIYDNFIESTIPNIEACSRILVHESGNNVPRLLSLLSQGWDRHASHFILKIDICTETACRKRQICYSLWYKLSNV